MNRILKTAISAALLISALALPGCKSIYKLSQPDLPEVTDFLPNHELLQQQKPEFPFQLFYLKEGTRSYKHIYIAPVNVSYLRQAKNWEAFDKKLAGKLGQNIQQLADFMRKEYSQAIVNYKKPNKPTVVDDPKLESTVIIETAIVSIVPTKAELNAIGLAGNLFLPGISVVVGRASAGSISVECKVRDAETGEVLSMYATTVRDQAAILNLKALSWYGSAQRNIEKLAKNTATIFATRDYLSIKRDFPFKIVTW